MISIDISHTSDWYFDCTREWIYSLTLPWIHCLIPSIFGTELTPLTTKADIETFGWFGLIEPTLGLFSLIKYIYHWPGAWINCVLLCFLWFQTLPAQQWHKNFLSVPTHLVISTVILSWYSSQYREYLLISFLFNNCWSNGSLRTSFIRTFRTL